MANWCTNFVEYSGADFKGISKLILSANSANPNGFKVGDQYIFDLYIHEDPLGIDGTFSFETKWGTEEDTVMALVELLNCSHLTLEYEEFGNQIGGIFEFENGQLSDTELPGAYWELAQKHDEQELEPPDFNDFI